MSQSQTIFKGNVRIYLQGEGALQPFDSAAKNPFLYYIGSPISQMIVRDFREEPINAAVQKLAGENTVEFSDIFCQPSFVLITNNHEAIEIELHQCKDYGDFPVLWLGVIHDRKMPVHNIAWENLIPIGNSETAFAILVDD